MSTITTDSVKNRSGQGLARIWDSYGMLVVFAVLFIACVLFVPNLAHLSI